MARVFGIVLLVLLGTLYVRNASWTVAVDRDVSPRLLSHRGVHQTYHRDGLTNETCTAARIDLPTHVFLENTIPSMEAAFELGAAVVELDIHPTTDGVHAVFHDWTIDCRTEGVGITREQSMDYLRSLDIGHGYTADEGETFPFRGKGVGMMPSLADVIEAMPDRQFLINLKSNDPKSGGMFADALDQHPEWQDRIWGVYGGDKSVAAFKMRFPDIRTYSRAQAKSCLKSYVAIGWTGIVPAPCRNTVINVPISHRDLMWGWPHALTARMKKAGTDVILLGDYTQGDVGTTGVDTEELWGKVPAHFDGYVWTNKIEVIGPLATK